MQQQPDTASNEAQVLSVDSEKIQTTHYKPIAHVDDGTVDSQGQPARTLPAPQDQRSQSGGRRSRVRALHRLVFCILFILAVLSTFKGVRKSVLAVKNYCFKSNSYQPVTVMNGNSEVHLPQDCIEVVEWDHVDVPGGYEGYSHVARASVDLPISSDLLYFLGRGVLSHGVIRFVDSGERDADLASVDVAFLYDENRLSDLLKVCRLHKSDSKNGVGIFSPERTHRPGNTHSTVVIEVKLPYSAAVRSLETVLPLFLHEVADFHDSVIFGTLSLKSTNMPIMAKYLTANSTHLQTSNSHISGVFNSSEAINIFTSNSFIEGNLLLSNGGGGSASSRINLQTSNSHIKARISLVSTAADRMNGSFDVVAQTSNAPLNVQFDSAPIDSRVTFKGRSTNSPAAVKLHETFEGSFTVNTGRWFEAGIHVVNTQDPSGRGRQRYVSRGGDGRGHGEGKATWGDAGGRRLGHAAISTTNSPVHLYL